MCGLLPLQFDSVQFNTVAEERVDEIPLVRDGAVLFDGDQSHCDATGQENDENQISTKASWGRISGRDWIRWCHAICESGQALRVARGSVGGEQRAVKPNKSIQQSSFI